jgi:RHS repeat-associated protein
VLQQSNGTVTTLLYSGDGDLRQRNANGTVLKFLRDGENLVQEVLGTATFRRYTDYPGEWGGLISVNDPSVANSSRFFTFDRMGSTRLMLTSSGSVENTMLFTGFGEQLVSTGADLKRFGYEGAFGYLRLTTNLMWVRERIYDANTGAWLSQDPIGFEGGDWNLFRYVKNVPTNLIDPAGLRDIVEDNAPQTSYEKIWEARQAEALSYRLGQQTPYTIRPDSRVAHPSPFGRKPTFTVGNQRYHGPKWVDLRVKEWMLYDTSFSAVGINHAGKRESAGRRVLPNSGRFDYKLDPSYAKDLFWINGGWHTAGALGNYAAGFGAQWVDPKGFAGFLNEMAGCGFEGLETDLSRGRGGPQRRADGWHLRSWFKRYWDSPTDKVFIHAGAARAKMIQK